MINIDPNVTDILIKRVNLDTGTHIGRTQCEEEGKDMGDVSTRQGMPKNASKPPDPTPEPWNRVSQPTEGSNPADTLILRLLASINVRQ